MGNTASVPARATSTPRVKYSRFRKRLGFVRPVVLRSIQLSPRYYATRFDINPYEIDDDMIGLDPVSGTIETAVMGFLARLIGKSLSATVSSRATNQKRRKAQCLSTIECRIEIIAGLWITRLDAPSTMVEDEAIRFIRTRINSYWLR